MTEKATIIVHSGDMDKVYSAFIIGNGALAMGMEVSMYFTFWGLQRLKKGGLEGGPLSKMHMLGLGKWMMQRLMKDSKFPAVEELMAMAKGMGVKFVACTTTMGFMGLSKEAFIPEVDSFAGVATYLAEASEGRVNLFI